MEILIINVEYNLANNLKIEQDTMILILVVIKKVIIKNHLLAKDKEVYFKVMLINFNFTNFCSTVFLQTKIVVNEHVIFLICMNEQLTL